MHDFTLILAVIAVVLLACQAEVDDRPPVHEEPWTRPREVDWTVFVFTAALVFVIAMLVFAG